MTRHSPALNNTRSPSPRLPQGLHRPVAVDPGLLAQVLPPVGPAWRPRPPWPATRARWRGPRPRAMGSRNGTGRVARPDMRDLVLERRQARPPDGQLHAVPPSEPTPTHIGGVAIYRSPSRMRSHGPPPNAARTCPGPSCRCMHAAISPASEEEDGPGQVPGQVPGRGARPGLHGGPVRFTRLVVICIRVPSRTTSTRAPSRGRWRSRSQASATKRPSRAVRISGLPFLRILSTSASV